CPGCISFNERLSLFEVSSLYTVLLRERSLSGSGCGTAESKDLVYGCIGLLYISSAEPNSTILPKCITAILSEIYLTMERSWAINRKVMLCSCCNFNNKLTTWA